MIYTSCIIQFIKISIKSSLDVIIEISIDTNIILKVNLQLILI